MSRQSDYVAAVLADAPVAYYKCDEGSGLLQDSSGNGKHTTTTRTGTGPSVGYGWGGPGDTSVRAIQSINTCFVVPSAVMSAQDNWTLECWAGASTQNQGAAPPLGLIAVGLNTAAGTPVGGNGYSLGIYNGGTFSLVNGLGTDFHGGGGTPGSGADPSNGAVYAAFGANSTRGSQGILGSPMAWSHILIIRRSGNLEYWVDGQMESPAFGAGFGPNVPTFETRIFKGNASFNAAEYMCHAAFYDHALSPTRIAAHRAILAAAPDADYPYLSFVHSSAGVQAPVEGRVTLL